MMEEHKSRGTLVAEVSQQKTIPRKTSRQRQTYRDSTKNHD